MENSNNYVLIEDREFNKYLQKKDFSVKIKLL